MRVINEIKRRNNVKEFVTKFAAQNGYPVWNKVLMATSQKQYANASLNGNSLDGVTDTTILIPFVMEGEFSVKGFIKATLNDSVSLSYSLAKDYKAYEEKLDNSKTASSAFAMLSMVLNKIVFNKDYYKITNPKLFSDDTAHVSTQSIKIENISFTITESAGLKYISLCGTSAIYKTYCPENGKCSEDGTSCDVPPSPCPSGGDICFCPQGQCYNYLSNSTTCSTIVLPDVSFGGGNGSGGDNGGGGEIPYVYPCETTQNNPTPFTATNNVDDPGDCPEPGPGDGWIPWQDSPEEDPCTIAQKMAKKMDTLYNKSKADSVLNTISNLATEPLEKEFPIYVKFIINPYNVHDTTFRDSCGAVQTGNDSSITISSVTSNLRKLAATLHTHPAKGYAAQSAKDIYNLIEETIQKPYYYGAFVVAANGDQYAITITEPAKASAFLNTKAQFLDGNKWKEDSDIEKEFKNAYDHFLDNDSTKRNYAYEMAMSVVLKQFNTGVTLNKKDANGNFKPIVVNTIIPNPNKPKKKVYTQDCL